MRRYPKYKDSGIEWLGEVPEHWNVRPLKYIGKIVLGKMLTNDDKGGYFKRSYLRAQNIIWEDVDINDIKEMWFSENELKQYRLREDDILVSEGGEVGRTAIWKNELNECYIQNSVHKITVNSGNDPHYYLYHFQIYGKTGFFESIVSKVSIAHLTREKLKDIIFLSPQSTEQQNIKNYLLKKTNQIDTFIKKKQTQIDLLKEYRTAIINEAVTKGLNPNVKMKDSGIEWLGEIPEHWEIKKLKHIGKVIGGFAFKSKDFTDNGIKVIKINNIQNLSMNWDDISYLPEHFFEQYKDYSATDGSLVFALTRPIISTGIKASVISISEDERILINQRTGIFKPQSSIKTRFIYYLVNNEYFIHAFSQKIKATNQPNISTDDIADLKIALPREDEQDEITNFLDKELSQVESIFNRINNQIQLLQQYRTSLISEVVTGKIDVRDEVQ